jgi:16S rRNA (cytidine1402-2'-O)-methyltransferase
MPHQNNSLFVVATPIGNLKDVTIRALDVLGSVDVIVSENVRKTRNLLKHYGIKTRIMSYREGNADRMIPFVVDFLRKGGSVALVAEAGTPGVSDPGRNLVRAVRAEHLGVVPVPGASAVTAAVSAAGLEESRFIFEGFLPRRTARRRQRLTDLARDQRVLVFYEAPHRLLKCLMDIRDVLGDRRCIIAREITKLHETIEEGSVRSLIERYSVQQPRGEFVIVCEGRSGVVEPIGSHEIQAEASDLTRRGMRKRDAAKIVAARHHLKVSDVYRIIARGIKSRTGGKG